MTNDGNEFFFGYPPEGWRRDMLTIAAPPHFAGYTVRTVLAHGCWDLLHIGHIEHLQEARKLGDRLVVSVSADDQVSKGMGRPHFTVEQRMKALRALACVDDVIVSNDATAETSIRAIKPAVYVKGIDYAGSNDQALAREKAAVEECGGRFVTTTSEKFSSSRLLNAQKFTPDVVEYLERCRTAGYRDMILSAFERADKLSIAFVGEIIIDEYRYVRGLGRPSKELMLAVVETGMETFEGGVVAASKHAEWQNVEWLSSGEGIKKTRYVDGDFKRKLFDVYSRQNITLPHGQRHRFQVELSRVTAESDMVVAMDFGHGLLEESERFILGRAYWLAVNVQTNAGNVGYNLATKYNKPHFICIDDPEARLAVGMQDEPIALVMAQLAEAIHCDKMIVTHGRYGSYYTDHPMAGLVGKAPAFAAGGIDTMGAGDAVMAVTAPLIAAGLSVEAAAFVGNIAGAIKTSIVGHRRPVGRQEIIQTVEALLA